MSLIEQPVNTGMTGRAGLQRAADFQAVLLGMIAHDLRQPLQVIQNVGDLLGVGIRTKSEQRLLRMGRHATDRLTRQLDQLLGALRLHDHCGGVKISAVALEPLFWQACRENKEFASQKGVEISVCPTTVSVMSNAVLLTGILRNLVSNAVKYTEPKGRVLIGCRRSSEYVRIDVYDTGIGITQDQLPGIFEAFHRLDYARCSGIGVGLFIVRRTADVLGHGIDVSSVVSRGSRFSISAARAD
ncbi:HAMP domain-containing sensor histidine kinase [Bradyrhizobium sp. dw_411]|uniref:sensor histidine kinase n=1 Tax=Bradyrhizobium sp. dw_411 TaxID=2720082 RepID=UPI001BCBAA86|nr:HAMP domain-containing sensor histidine kinase [Bradyrhizobium sp. dw_411]